MLTLFYVSATYLQSRRINSVCHKIGEQLGQKASITFYALPPKTEDGFDTNLATSELCLNRNAAKVTEILWLLGSRRGCSLSPVQCVHVAPWITFPESPSWLPFAYNKTSELILERLKSYKNVFHLLLETDIQPCRNNEHGNLGEVVKIENYGKLIAWKMDSHLALIIETDVEYFTKLLIATFFQNNFLVNDHLPLLRIESILTEGTPQPFELLKKHLKKPSRTTALIDKTEWQKHLEGLRALSVLASQATEFEYNKNRTEGKIGVVKPDLIPQEKKLKKDDSKSATPHQTPQKDVPINKSKESPSKLLSGGGKKIVSPTKLASTTAEKTQKLIEAEASKTITSTEIQTASSRTSEAKAAGESRFKTTKINESPLSETLAPTVKPNSSNKISSPDKTAVATTKTESELEKLAAAAATAALKKSPIHATTAKTTPNTPISSPSKMPTTTPTKSITTDIDSTVKNQTVAPSPSTPTPMPTLTTTPLTTANNSLPKPIAGISAQQNNAKRPSLKRSKDSIKECKPLNILVYSDSSSARDSAVVTLRDILEPNMYTIYPLTSQQVEQKHWIENTALLVVCGSVVSNIGEILVDYFLHGGKVLSLCSDILHFILPTYRTAEIREHELVQFSYDKWQKVKMMHHIFCYQPSPVKKHFSTESEEPTQPNSRKSALVCPRSIELKDLHGQTHNLDVRVLGSEETWNTPSLLLANTRQSGGKAVFSQVHLETSPSQFETDELRYSVLMQNEKIRMEIFADLLSKHLDINVKAADNTGKCVYQNAFFLGRHECKFELLEKLKPKMGADNVITTTKLTMKFCGKNETAPKANTNVLPILIHSCPDDFSTVDYFDNLKTTYIGRLLIYAPIVNSTMNVINQLELTQGIAVLARQQSEGVGRSNNQWLSPLGCAMFSIQLHISLNSALGGRLPLLQHLIAVGVINCLKSHQLYKNLDIGLKWPNDIYANGLNKIGGLIVTTTIMNDQAIVNIGCGINLDNSKPTTCINDMINELNQQQQQKLPKLKYEEFIALIFNEIERLVEQVQTGNFEDFYKLYYAMWLHNEQSIIIADNDGQNKEATVIGIDDYGYLKVKLANGTVETVQPDGNSFDMLKGLIVPKYN